MRRRWGVDGRRRVHLVGSVVSGRNRVVDAIMEGKRE